MRDRGSIVLGWLTRVTLILTLLGLAGFELLSVLVTRVAIEDIGQTAALEAIEDYKLNHDTAAAFHAASAEAEGQGASIIKKTFEIDDQSVTFELTKTAPTLLLYRVEATAGLAKVETTVYAEPLEEGGRLP